MALERDDGRAMAMRWWRAARVLFLLWFVAFSLWILFGQPSIPAAIAIGVASGILLMLGLRALAFRRGGGRSVLAALTREELRALGRREWRWFGAAFVAVVILAFVAGLLGLTPER
jgi:hypothetical protein